MTEHKGKCEYGYILNFIVVFPNGQLHSKVQYKLNLLTPTHAHILLKKQFFKWFFNKICACVGVNKLSDLTTCTVQIQSCNIKLTLPSI